MEEEEEGKYQDEQFDDRDGIYLPREERRYEESEGTFKYRCKSDGDLKADTGPEVNLYCSMIAFIKSSEFPHRIEEQKWFGYAGEIVDIIVKLGPKYVNYINGPCLIIAYVLVSKAGMLNLNEQKNDGSNEVPYNGNLHKVLSEEMGKYLLHDKKTGIRTEKDIYRYVRFWILYPKKVPK